MPERLLKSGLVFAPAVSLRATPARLPAIAKRRYTAADIDDYPNFVDSWERAQRAAPRVRLQMCSRAPSLALV